MRASSPLIALVTLPLASPALAHGGAAYYLTADGAWSTDPFILAPLYATAIFYLLGTRRLWARAGHGRGVRHWQAAAFWAGWTTLTLALISPLHWLAEQLFFAHMIEHEIMMLISAPLLVVSRPIGAFLWALPAAWRRVLGAAARTSAWSAPWRLVTNPGAATVLHGVALWAWHAPLPFAAALASDWLHWAQHLSFLLTALLFWWSLVKARERGYGVAIVWLFVTMLHSGLLGILLALSREPWVPRQTDVGADWGLTPLEDQQLAGLIMWVPAGLIYTAAALGLAGAWIMQVGARHPRQPRRARSNGDHGPRDAAQSAPHPASPGRG